MTKVDNFITIFKSKPLGVKVISLLFFVFGLFCARFIITIAGIITLPLTILFFVLSIGIYKLRSWAHAFVGAFSIIWVIFAAYMVSKVVFEHLGTPETLLQWGRVIAFAAILFFCLAFIPLAIYGYLTKTKVKEYFK